MVRVLKRAIQTQDIVEIVNKEFDTRLGAPEKHAYVSESRINELKTIQSNDFDLSKLIQFCTELNVVWRHKSYCSVMFLVRAILDHIPPIFGCNKFNEVSNNYAGSKSFKDSMSQLGQSSRKIADNHLHSQIRKAEVLPNDVQVNFSQSLDVLLAEIVRVLKP
ncbi:hypothetical protein ACSYAD_21795 [Acaryochloris marina NIES-2412]|uniref:hypothetical protein n=1 Tax=Acaryochloris marina TaxID=155978 RepID=UPI004059BCF3